MQKYIATAARVLLSQIFFVAILITLAQITSIPQGYNAYYAKMMSYHLPGLFAPLTIFIQFVFGLGLLLGYKTKVCSFVLAIFAIFVALFMKLQEPNGLILTMQYLAIAGGLLLLYVNPNTALSLDNRKKSQQ